MSTPSEITWKGVLIEESLTDTSILAKMHILETKSTTLEGEADKGMFHFHSVEVTGENLKEITQFVATHLRDSSWYFHLVNDNEMIVIFPNKILKAHKDKPEEVEQIRAYGISQGILGEQLGLERLFDNPFS